MLRTLHNLRLLKISIHWFLVRVRIQEYILQQGNHVHGHFNQCLALVTIKKKSKKTNLFPRDIYQACAILLNLSYREEHDCWK